jgi:hypothetical protein
MRTTLRTALCVATVLLLCQSASADIETQGWHQDPANTPSQEHLHQIVKGISPLDVLGGQPRVVQVSVLLHNSKAHVNYVRWQCESDAQQTVNVNWTGTGAHEETFGPVSLNIDPAKCPGAWREIRIAANSDTGAPGGRTFPTTRLCVSTTGSGTNYCNSNAAGRHGGGQWYQASAYHIAWIHGDSLRKINTRSLVAGDTLQVKAQNDSGGCIYAHIDPKFHDFNPGIVAVNCKPSDAWQTLTIPAGLAAGTHKLVIRAHGTNGEEGVYVQPFTVGT